MYVPHCCKQKVTPSTKQRKQSNFDTNTHTHKDNIKKDYDLRWHAPLYFQGQQTWSKADRILCLCKLLTRNPFWESSTVHVSVAETS